MPDFNCIPVAGTPGRVVPLFCNQQESVEHVKPHQRALHSLVRPRLPTVVEPEPQRTSSERQQGWGQLHLGEESNIGERICAKDIQVAALSMKNRC